jgi:M6 family metalloprotease-like protein
VSQASRALAAPAGAPSASGWTLIKFPQGQPACTGVGFIGPVYYDRLDCGFGFVQVSETSLSLPNRSVVKVSFIDSAGVTQNTQTTTARTADNAWQFSIFPVGSPPTAWAAGPVTIRVTEVDTDGTGSNPNEIGNFGETSFFLNQLGATLAAVGSGHQPGEAFDVTGTTFEIDQVPPLAAPQETAVGATFSLQVTRPDGTAMGPYGPFTADPLDGTFTEEIPAEATDGLTAGPDSNFQVTVGIEVVDASYADPVTGAWVAERAGAGALTLSVPPDSLVLENSFVSSVGWVKPGDTYPSRVFVKNFGDAPATSAQVTITAADGMAFTNAVAVAGSGTCTHTAGSVSWSIGSIPAATSAGPGIATCVLEAKADTAGQDPQIVWKDLSTTATLTYDDGPPAGLTSASHGPKVIPPDERFDTARYGDRPFPVVPVDFADRSHEETHTGEALANKINSPGVPGSTFNLYQEMSYGQLHPRGDVPSAAIATADFGSYGPGFDFTNAQPAGTCRGFTYEDADAVGTALHPERVRDGWYQLPGTTDYYGDDKFGSALPGAIVGIGPLLDIDSACGPTGKAVYDAAQIADPEIDYSDFDTDKDGVVDFFMMVFVGVGGNGVSQTSVPPYDNIWPHSSSLEFYYTDPDTGLKGYISDDQLKDLEGNALFWTNASRSQMTTDDTDIPVYVRVGPYNVNPESAIDKASVISHEYGHSLGLPDFYSIGGRETYGTWNLMATDHSQNMDVFSKQELGWIVPNVLDPGETVTISNWQDSKRNTHQITWEDANGNPYMLSGPGVNNGEAYVAKLPARQIIDPDKVAAGASPTHVWWSRSGNDFGCTPEAAHNFDIYLPELATYAAGTPVTVSFKSYWDIEWDFDYGFVMASTDGTSYTALPSEEGYSTPQGQNPNANTCQAQYGNGLTGTSGSHDGGTKDVDRVLGNYPDGGFLPDSYDMTAFAGQAAVLRFSYATDPGLARPGWFIDDLTVTVGSDVIYSSDFEAGEDEPRVFNGGCRGTESVAAQCTDGWQYVDAAAGSPADHAYYLEMRDRSSFDLDGKGEDDRGNGPTFAGGLLLVYTDEAHGYGNFGTDDPPAQSPLDSQPQPGESAPNLDDAAFTAATGDGTFSDFGEGWTDNYEDPSSEDGNWHFAYDCLSFNVDLMTGDGNGPSTVPPYDLTGTVSFTMGAGCAEYDYGHGAPTENAAPTAVADAKPPTAAVGEEITFDGSGSSDDRQAPNELTYAWDFDDGTPDGVGQVVHHAFAAAGSYDVTLTVTDANGASDTDTVTVTITGEPNLVVEDITTVQNTGTGGNGKPPKEGDKVIVRATIENTGTADAGPSETAFLLDETAMAGSPVATPAIPAGASVDVDLDWDTRGVKGDHVISVTADSGEAVAESDEDNNTSTLTVSVKGNKVTNGDFSEPNAAGDGPEAWEGSSTGAGSTSWSQSGGTEDSRAATISGTGGNVALDGMPTWTSDSIEVSPGQTLSLRVSVSSDGLSSAPAVGLAYLGAAGELLNTVRLIDVPLASDGFITLEQVVTLPPGVAQVRVVLFGFSPTDLRTAGTVIFDDIGLFEE